MTAVFADTSGLIALLNGRDEHHAAAARAFRKLQSRQTPLSEVAWVDATLHEAGLDLLLTERRRQLSLVDALSLVVMAQRRLEGAFAFDPHFEQEGFTLLR